MTVFRVSAISLFIGLLAPLAWAQTPAPSGDTPPVLTDRDMPPVADAPDDPAPAQPQAAPIAATPPPIDKAVVVDSLGASEGPALGLLDFDQWRLGRRNLERNQPLRCRRIADAYSAGLRRSGAAFVGKAFGAHQSGCADWTVQTRLHDAAHRKTSRCRAGRRGGHAGGASLDSKRCGFRPCASGRTAHPPIVQAMFAPTGQPRA